MARFLSRLTCALILCSAGCGFPSPLCGEQSIAETSSPDGRITAASFKGDCGATTGYSTHVNLRSSSVPFTADSDGRITEGEVIRIRGEAWLKLSWESSKILLIECGNCSGVIEVVEKAARWQDVTIAFRGT